jgi:peptide deformylase
MSDGIQINKTEQMQAVIPVRDDHFQGIQNDLEKAILEIDEKGTGWCLGPHIGQSVDIIYFYGLLKDGDLCLCANPTWIPTGKRINTAETFLSDGKTYLCDRFKTITAIFYSFNMQGKLIKITKNLTGEKAIMFQHAEQYLHSKLRGIPLEEDEK